jgi:hypothetical protein
VQEVPVRIVVRCSSNAVPQARDHSLMLVAIRPIEQRATEASRSNVRYRDRCNDTART